MSAKVFEETFQDFGSNMGIAVELTFPTLTDEQADDIEVPDKYIDSLFANAEKGKMSGTFELYYKGDENVPMNWKITAYESEDDEKEEEEEGDEDEY